MPHECGICGETFTTWSRLRLHDCPHAELTSQSPASSSDAFIDSISDAFEANVQPTVQGREDSKPRAKR